MKIAMLAPPWLSIPPVGYGGIENMLAVLVPALMDLGAEVELFTTGESTLKATRNHVLYPDEQYGHIHAPAYHSIPIAIAHSLFAFNKIKEVGDFDIIHTHNEYAVDPLIAAFASSDLPPTVHTLHGPPFTTPDRLAQGIPDNMSMWTQIGLSQKLASRHNLSIVPISRAMADLAPKALKHIMLRPVHNSVDASDFPFLADKRDYFITIGRSHPDKGWGIAARLCAKLGYSLKIAGIVGNLNKPKAVMLQIGNPSSEYRSLADFRYFSDEVFPYLDEGAIEYIGNLVGQRKLDMLSHAKGFLFPIQWNEPFGMVAIEALACGTPVVAMARGSLPEIVEHGVNGFLANNEKEFEAYMLRVGEIDPAACRRSVEQRFSGLPMAKRYMARYKTAIRRSRQIRR